MRTGSVVSLVAEATTGSASKIHAEPTVTCILSIGRSISGNRERRPSRPRVLGSAVRVPQESHLSRHPAHVFANLEPTSVSSRSRTEPGSMTASVTARRSNGAVDTRHRTLSFVNSVQSAVAGK